jgi:DNA repair protein RecN (Recombination protein N)
MSVPRDSVRGMLRELHISGLGVIDDLDLEFHSGLNVLTGETGAGKTMVTVGLALALGGRATPMLVRAGSAAARVQARFDAGPDAGEWAEDGEVILARTVSAGGRGSARIGGQIATASALASLGADLVEVHGQHQAQRLLAPATQTAFCDRFAGDTHIVALAAYREAFDRLRVAREELELLSTAARDRERELDLLAYQVREIDGVAPVPGERQGLEAEEGRLAHVERLLVRAGEALAALSGDDGLVDAEGAAATALADAAALDPGAADVGERAASLAADTEELARDVRNYLEHLQDDPARLEEVRSRIQALAALERRYGATEQEVLAFREQASARLEVLAGADDRRASLAEEVEALSGAVANRAATVTAGRVAAAPALGSAIEAELQELGMEGATVEVLAVALETAGPGGFERMELRLAPGAGQRPLPVAKAASGGELSRTMLACRSVMADLDAVPTLVFDEVDAGIGGRAGLAVGRRLARLAEDRQVIVVTHLPQIACFADRQFRVTKEEGTATVRILEDAERVEELARMLAGLPGGEGAASHAEELLQEAGRARSTR